MTFFPGPFPESQPLFTRLATEMIDVPFRDRTNRWIRMQGLAFIKDSEGNPLIEANTGHDTADDPKA